MSAVLLLAVLQDFIPIKDAKPGTIETRRTVEKRAFLGVSTADHERGAKITSVGDESPAELSGVLVDDVVMRIDDEVIKTPSDLRSCVRTYKPGKQALFRLLRGGEEIDLPVTFGEGSSSFFGAWTKPKFRLAVILVEFEDVKHNPKIGKRDVWRMMFSKGEYTGKNVTGEEVFGSLRDYYLENSYGKLDVTGRVFGWMAVEHPRDYFETKAMGSKAYTRDFMGAAIERVKKEEGDDVFDEFDGLVILHAGDQSHHRPMALWPHRSSTRVGKRSVPYFLSSEGGKFLASIGVHCHEFGHMVGLPDQYGKNHSTGVGKWCLMSVGHMGGGESRNHRPYQLCAWCKEQLGWVKPVVLDPRDVQRLRLDAVEKNASAVGKILIQPDASEYYLIENRQRIGFDSDLDADGLLIWRVTRGGRVDLVEGHGRDVANASLVEPEEIAFPNAYNEHFTPDTFPSSLGRKGGGLKVYLKEIREREGSITLTIGEVFDAETWEPPSGRFH